MIPLRFQHWRYVWIPIVAAFMWFATLLAMLLTWVCTGRPKYVSEEGKIAYISDVGADILKPLFVTGSAITGVGFFLSLLVERYLRHSGRLMPHMRMRERVCGTLAVFGSFVGGCGLILLSVFDTKRHPSLHRAFLLVFMVGVAISAIFTVIEYRWIRKDFPNIKRLKIASIAKGVIAAYLILLAIAFGITLYKAQDVGAILEWIISFSFTFYILTYFYDLRQSKNVQRGQLTRERMMATDNRSRPYEMRGV